MTDILRPAQSRVARQCYLLLRAELARRLAASGRWHGVPALLDELDALRRLHDEVPRALEAARVD